MNGHNARTGKARGICGVGWEKAENFFKRYGRVTPQEAEKARRIASEILEVKQEIQEAQLVYADGGSQKETSGQDHLTN